MHILDQIWPFWATIAVSHGRFRKKKSQKVFPLPTVRAPSASNSLSDLKGPARFALGLDKHFTICTAIIIKNDKEKVRLMWLNNIFLILLMMIAFNSRYLKIWHPCPRSRKHLCVWQNFGGNVYNSEDSIPSLYWFNPNQIVIKVCFLDKFQQLSWKDLNALKSVGLKIVQSYFNQCEPVGSLCSFLILARDKWVLVEKLPESYI